MVSAIVTPAELRNELRHVSCWAGEVRMNMPYRTTAALDPNHDRAEEVPKFRPQGIARQAHC
jgi:hypothetical protein